MNKPANTDLSQVNLDFNPVNVGPSLKDWLTEAGIVNEVYARADVELKYAQAAKNPKNQS